MFIIGSVRKAVDHVTGRVGVRAKKAENDMVIAGARIKEITNEDWGPPRGFGLK